MANENIGGDDYVADEFSGGQNVGGQNVDEQQFQQGGQEYQQGHQQQGYGQQNYQQENYQQQGYQQSGGSGLSPNVAGALSYLFGIITGLIFFVIEKEDRFVRFHAAQSIALFGGIFLLSIVLSVVGTVISIVTFSGSTGGFFVGGIVSLVLGLVWLALWFTSLVLWVYLMYSAYKGKTPRIPVAAGIADRLVN